MKRKVIIGIAIILLAFVGGCSNPFFPALKIKDGETNDNEISNNPVTPSISSHPQSAVYTIDAQATALTVTATKSDSGVLSYQWYSNNVDFNTGGTLISGETLASYTPPTDELGTVYFYVVVINTLNGKAATTISNAARIEVNDKVNAAVPQITTQPQGATYVLNATADALEVVATRSDSGTLSYQWYSNTENSNEGGEEIEDETDDSYTPSTNDLGTVYYYVIVTNTITDNFDGGAKTATVSSNTAEVKILTNEQFTQARIIKEIADNMVSLDESNGLSFKMGSPVGEPNRATSENYRSANDGIVTLSPFSISKFPVTQEQYQAVIGSNPSHFRAGGPGSSVVTEMDTSSFPVEQVNWYDAIEFCNRLSMLEDLIPAYILGGQTDPALWGTKGTGWNSVQINPGSNGYRLPTEAQWEYACRAGTETAYYFGDSITTSQANFNNTLGRTTQVGIYPANDFELHDMHGNVFEWCWDWYTASYDSAGGSADPVGATSGSFRVFRGGCWRDIGQDLRSAFRGGSFPLYGGDGLGFRLVRPGF